MSCLPAKIIKAKTITLWWESCHIFIYFPKAKGGDFWLIRMSHKPKITDLDPKL